MRHRYGLLMTEAQRKALEELMKKHAAEVHERVRARLEERFGRRYEEIISTARRAGVFKPSTRPSLEPPRLEWTGRMEHPTSPAMSPSEKLKLTKQVLLQHAKGQGMKLTTSDIMVHANIAGVDYGWLENWARSQGIKIIRTGIEHPTAMPIRSASYISTGSVTVSPTTGTGTRTRPSGSTTSESKKEEKKLPPEEKVTRFVMRKVAAGKYIMDPGSDFDWYYECVEQELPENAKYVKMFLKCIRRSR